MRVYTYSEARQQLTELLNSARREGQVEIRRRDGQRFVVRPTQGASSPLDVPGVEAGLSRQEIVGLVRESRRSIGRLIQRKRKARSSGNASAHGRSSMSARIFKP